MFNAGWSGVGPCTDWTTLDPAIVSSSRPQNYLAVTSSTNHHPPLNTSTNPSLHLLHNTGSIPQQNKPPVEQQNTAMSSANPPSAPIAIPQLHQLQQNNVGHWLRSLSSEEGSCVFYNSNVLGGSSADWAASTNHSGSVNGQQQQNHIFYGSNILGGGSADWAASSNHLGNANGQQQQNHLVGSPNSGSVTMSAPPPPGFSSMRLAAMQQGTATASCIQKKQCSLVNTDMGQIESELSCFISPYFQAHKFYNVLSCHWHSCCQKYEINNIFLPRSTTYIFIMVVGVILSSSSTDISTKMSHPVTGFLISCKHFPALFCLFSVIYSHYLVIIPSSSHSLFSFFGILYSLNELCCFPYITCVHTTICNHWAHRVWCTPQSMWCSKFHTTGLPDSPLWPVVCCPHLNCWSCQAFIQAPKSVW